MRRLLYVLLTVTCLCIYVYAEEADLDLSSSFSQPSENCPDDDISLTSDVDITRQISASFHDIALLPTRLTAYNQHDDAATASYTCCRVRQEKEIKAAIEANEAFLHRFSDTSFADFTLIHYGYVAGFLPDAFRNREWAYRTLYTNYPDSHLADDATFHLAGLYSQDGDHDTSVDLYEELIDKYPDSPWADQTLRALINEYSALERPEDALDALNQLAHNYPKSELCPQALFDLACKYAEKEQFESAIRAWSDLIKDYPNNDITDDAQWQIAQCYRRMGDQQLALDAYNELVDRWYGSSLSNPAMLEANNLSRAMTGQGQGRELYDTLDLNPAKEAQELWEEACHYQNLGTHAEAVATFEQFIDEFPGNDLWDDAWYQIGVTYLRQEMLFQNINSASGPDDLERYQEDYSASTGDTNPVPADGTLSALANAQEAFAHIANELKGSALQCDALGQVARCFIKYGEIETSIPTDAAYTYQEMIINFPTSSVRCPWFTDATWPVYAFCRLIDFYANEANWEVSQAMYPTISAEFPSVFPGELEQNKDMFLELMRLYQLKSAHAYYEMSRHIPYQLGPADLIPEAHYFQAAMLMDIGEFQQASSLLEPLIKLQGHGLVAPAIWLYAQANARLGNWDAFSNALNTLIEEHKNSGLADDAQLCLIQYQEAAQNPAKFDISASITKAQNSFGIVPTQMDYYIGDNCVVFAPFTRCAAMRMYNMPNIWDEAQRVLRDWAGLKDNEKLVIVVDSNDASTFGNPFKVPGSQIKDPPAWSIGLTQIAANTLGQGIPQLADNNTLLSGIGRFMAASLQYDLVTETRDAIGSAAAVKLPQEEVIRNREMALKALQDYVIAGEDAQLNPDAVAGMMYALLDANGYTKDRLIDREPYRTFFTKLKAMPSKTECGTAFAMAAQEAFGTGCNQQLKDWRLPLTTNTGTGDVKISMTPKK